MAFTRNPSDTSVSPATYTADGASDLLLVDQQRDVAIDGSDEKDLVFVSASALASNALYNFDVRGFAGDDTIDIRANLIQDSTINGNIGNDTIYAGFSGVSVEVDESIIVGSIFGEDGSIIASSIETVTETVVAGAITNLDGSYILGGKDDDAMFGYGLNDGEINGNIGDDTLSINNRGVVAGFNMYVGGGQGNDLIDVAGDYTNSIIDGNKGIDTINVFEGNHSNSSVNGGEGNDIIRSASATTKGLMINGDLGDDTLVSIGNLASTVTGGEGKDTIVSVSVSGQKSIIDAGVGADLVLTDSVGSETIVFNNGDSVAATEFDADSNEPDTIIAGTITFDDGVDTVIFGEDSVITNDKIDIDFDIAELVIGDSLLNTDNLATNVVYRFLVDDLGDDVFTINAESSEGSEAYLYIVGGQNLTAGQAFTNSTNMFVSDTILFEENFV